MCPHLRQSAAIFLAVMAAAAAGGVANDPRSQVVQNFYFDQDHQ